MTHDEVQAVIDAMWQRSRDARARAETLPLGSAARTEQEAFSLATANDACALTEALEKSERAPSPRGIAVEKDRS